MDPTIVANHRITSACAVRFLEYSVNQGRCLKRLDLLDDSMPDYLRNYPYPLHSWPWFISKEMQTTLAECVTRVPDLIYRAIRLEFGRDRQRFAAFYELPEVLAEIFLDSGFDLAQLILRIDAMMTADGLKIMEVNAGPDIGGWQIHWTDGLYRKNEALLPFFSANEHRPGNIPLAYMKHVVQMARAHDKEGAANVLFVVGKQHLTSDLNDLFQLLFRDALNACDAKGELFFESSFENVRFDSYGASLRGHLLGSIVPFRFGTDIVAPLDLYRAFLRGQLYLPENPFVGIIGDKRSLAIACRHKDSDHFTSDERRLIDSFIPWSATIAPGTTAHFRQTQLPMEESLLRHRHELVIKVARGAQGNDVFVGKFQSEQAWREIVARALSEPMWLAQEYCESLPFYGQAGEEGYGIYDVIWGVFGFGKKYGGCWLRLSQKDSGDGVINSAKGAQEAIVYEVNEP